MVIDLLRHGETTAGQCFIGRSDVLLTETGWQQMYTAVTDQQYDLVISSPLSRCLDFVKQYTTDTNLEWLVEQDFREYDFGEWEGKLSKDLWASHRALMSGFWEDPWNHPPPGGEDFKQFQARVSTAMNRHLQTLSGKKILVVAHGGVIRQIFVCLLNKSWHQAMKMPVGHGERLRMCMTDNGLKLEDDCFLCDYM
ncbi:MAG TPA: histidine phosphatase family protein [Gammaproteobacteria bacterium]|nr:histidine phosphatase family protein [Gammaproteobacteria bacterium]